MKVVWQIDIAMIKLENEHILIEMLIQGFT